MVPHQTGVRARAQQLVPPEPQKHYIEGAEFSDRDKLKELGARWDPGSSRWYHTDPEIARQAQAFVDSAHHKYFLEGDTGQVFAVKEKLKELGAQWDPDSKKWYHQIVSKLPKHKPSSSKGPDRHYIEGVSLQPEGNTERTRSRMGPPAQPVVSHQSPSRRQGSRAHQ